MEALQFAAIGCVRELRFVIAHTVHTQGGVQTDRGAQISGEFSAEDIEIIGRVESFAKKKGWTMAWTAFPWSRSRTTAPILGISSEARLKEFVAAVDFELMEEKAYLEPPYRGKGCAGFNLDRTSS
jgi:aryl-alcohol dehydrogenase-like predicted oxidoreductase